MKASASMAQDLMSYTIQPVQRVPRYVLLLKELKKWTLVSHEEYADLESALSKVSAIALEINEGKRQLENMSKLMAIQAGIKQEKNSTFNLIQPDRVLIKQGEVKMIQAKGMFGSMKVSDRVLYLFNDILLWTGQKNKYKGHMRIGGINLEEKDASPDSFTICNANELLHIRFADEAMKDEWQAATSTAIKNTKAQRKQAMSKKMMRNKSINKSRAQHKQMLQSLSNASETGNFESNLQNADAGEGEMDVLPATAEPKEAKFKIRQIKSRGSRTGMQPSAPA